MLYQETWQKVGMTLQIKRKLILKGKRYVQKEDIRFQPQMYIKSISDNLHSLDIRPTTKCSGKREENIYDFQLGKYLLNGTKKKIL